MAQNVISIVALAVAAILTDPARANVRLTVPGAARVYGLGSSGKRGRVLDTKVEAGVFEIDPAGAASIWCEIVSP